MKPNEVDEKVLTEEVSSYLESHGYNSAAVSGIMGNSITEPDEPVDDVYLEMAMIAYDTKLNISVNQEMKRLSVAYFKVYDHEKYASAKHVARLHFKDSGMEYHTDRSGKDLWKLNANDVSRIIKLLQARSNINPDYTNWQVACYQWNYHNGLAVNIKDYFDGKYDHMYDDDSRLNEAYVPSTQKMPEEWVYDKSKAKYRSDADTAQEEAKYEAVDDVYLEMATIARDRDNGILISVNPEREYLNIPYFKVYDNSSVNKSDRVIRLHFKDNGMEYHKDPIGKSMWDLNSKDEKNIINLLKDTNKTNKSYTNWQMLCYQWNLENDLVDSIDEYFSGKYDDNYANIKDTNLQEAYVPSTQEMPDGWICNPPKGMFG